MDGKKTELTELFGSMVFNEAAMESYLSAQSFQAWKDCIRSHTSLDPAVANDIAQAMKRWATERGATHFSHWFQPMTGYTAEKHDSFITPAPGARCCWSSPARSWCGASPTRPPSPPADCGPPLRPAATPPGTPPPSPSCGTAPCTSPRLFCSYSGQVLDKKTPLLRSMEEVSRQAVRILRLFGDEKTQQVTAQVGPEQEYFLIDEKDFAKRLDLRLCGRTLFGAKPPKGQELEDHYFGAIRPRVAAYMQDLDRELWKLGVLSKTKHNEVAPCQHEMAPIYSDANSACDHNQITMDVMKKVARRHGLVCLLHEKPFAGINGSGKHDNWSLSTDTGDNLFKPGRTPSQNAASCCFGRLHQGVDEYQEFLRCTVAYAGNDHRLGAQEAPPAVVSIFLGDELTAVVDSIIRGTEYADPGKRSLRIGVDVMPPIPQDNTDRNRTSPLAFTGNKFEFRMLGSSQSIAGPNIALNTIMAEELEQFADELEGPPTSTRPCLSSSAGSLLSISGSSSTATAMSRPGSARPPAGGWPTSPHRRRPARLHRRQERGAVCQARHLHPGGDGGPAGDPHGELLHRPVHRGPHHGGYAPPGYPARRVRLRRPAVSPPGRPGRSGRGPLRVVGGRPGGGEERRPAVRLREAGGGCGPGRPSSWRPG